MLYAQAVLYPRPVLYSLSRAPAKKCCTGPSTVQENVPYCPQNSPTAESSFTFSSSSVTHWSYTTWALARYTWESV